MLKIGLDAGHGSTDPGARDNQGNYEREQMIRLVDEIERQAISKGISVAKYPNEQNSYANGNLGSWAKNNGVTEMVEFHFDTGSAGSILISPDADQVDKNLNAVINSYFGSKGIVSRTDLYNVNALAKVGIPYRLVETYGGHDENDINKFNAELPNLARDILNAIVSGHDGGESNPPQETIPPQSNCWAAYDNYVEIQTPKITDIWESGTIIEGLDTREPRVEWAGNDNSRDYPTFAKVVTGGSASWVPGCGQGLGSLIGNVKYKKVLYIIGEDGNRYDSVYDHTRKRSIDFTTGNYWIISHVNGKDQFTYTRKED